MGWNAALFAFFLVACGPAPRRNGIGPGGSADAGSNGSGCENTCSSDLHSVIDCNGNIVSTCPADQGCANQTCLPACDAAAADKSSIGCDYYAVDPDIIFEGVGGCFAAYIANTWGSPIAISVDYN